MITYKIGDKVRIRPIEYFDSIATRRIDIGGYCLPNGMYFLFEMEKFCNKTVTISKVTSRGRYRIEEDTWYWSDSMIEGLATVNLGEIYE